MNGEELTGLNDLKSITPELSSRLFVREVIHVTLYYFVGRSTHQVGLSLARSVALMLMSKLMFLAVPPRYPAFAVYIRC